MDPSSNRRSALLIDADGLCVKHLEVAALIEELVEPVGPFEHMFAAGNVAACRVLLRSLRAASVETRPAPNTNNAADEIVRERAAELVHAGFSDLYLFTGDNDLARIQGTIHLIVIGDDPALPRLSRRARSVLRVGATPETPEPSPLMQSIGAVWPSAEL